MPMLRLAAPYLTGDFDAVDYGYAKIVGCPSWDLMKNNMVLTVMHGSFDSGAQVFSECLIQTPDTVKRYELLDTDYATAVAAASGAAGENYCEYFMKAIYEWLIAMTGSPYAGATVVDNLDQPYGA